MHKHGISRNNISNTGSYTFILTEAERNVLRSYAKNSNTLPIKYVIGTVVDGIEKWWSVKDATMHIVNANPIFNNFTFKDINTKTVALTGSNQKIISGYSNIETIVSVANKAEAQKQANMSKYRLQVGTQQVDANYSSTEDVSMTLNNVDNNVIRVYAIDSRGNTTSKDLAPSEFLQYTDIKITNASVYRDNGGVSTETILELAGEFWNKSFGSVTNSVKSVRIQHKQTSLDTWIDVDTITVEADGNIFSKTTKIKGDLGANGFDSNNSYDIRVTVEDELSTFATELTLGSGRPAIAIARQGVAFNAPYDEELGGSVQVDGKRIAKDFISTKSKQMQALTTQFQTIKLDNIIVKNTELLNLSNNKITCSKDGTIFVTARIFCGEGFNNNDNVRLAIFKNNINVYVNAHCIVSSYNSLTLSTILEVKNGDSISLNVMNYNR